MKLRLVLVGVVALGWAQLGSAAPGDDPRIKTVEYSQGGLIPISTSPETTQTVLFAPGERIQSVIVSDSSAYQVAVSGAGDSLTLKANGISALAVLSVRTDQRGYELELVPGAATATAPIIRFGYGAAATTPRAPQAVVRPVQVPGFVWRVGGAKALRPLAVRDDGAKIYIEWRSDQSMPAVFAIDPTGREEMVDSYVRDGMLTIDHMHRALIFRIDKAKATAQRAERKKSDG
jgi:type IV secretion system protein VirB9